MRWNPKKIAAGLNTSPLLFCCAHAEKALAPAEQTAISAKSQESLLERSLSRRFKLAH